ncbi:MAG: T9SS type A sorting domain-containing protein [Acidobacteria bacterium]|nr:T9SS type A sorting domain-containing protein [Acidobacteriota bacterium]
MCNKNIFHKICTFFIVSFIAWQNILFSESKDLPERNGKIQAIKHIDAFNEPSEGIVTEDDEMDDVTIDTYGDMIFGHRKYSFIPKSDCQGQYHASINENGIENLKIQSSALIFGETGNPRVNIEWSSNSPIDLSAYDRVVFKNFYFNDMFFYLNFRDYIYDDEENIDCINSCSFRFTRVNSTAPEFYSVLEYKFEDGFLSGDPLDWSSIDAVDMTPQILSNTMIQIDDIFLSNQSTLSVGLTSFTALEKDHSVILHWITESELENLGFILEKKESSEESWSRIASYETHDELKGQGNKSSRTEYSFTDKEVEPGREYFYRLSDVSTNGTVTERLPVYLKTEENFPYTTQLSRPFPNPFNPSTRINYQLEKDSRVSLSVFDLSGRKVKDLFSGDQVSGSHQVEWDGTDGSGRRVSNGCYIIRLEAGDFTHSEKVAVVR